MAATGGPERRTAIDHDAAGRRPARWTRIRWSRWYGGGPSAVVIRRRETPANTLPAIRVRRTTVGYRGCVTQRLDRFAGHRLADVLRSKIISGTYRPADVHTALPRSKRNLDSAERRNTAVLLPAPIWGGSRLSRVPMSRPAGLVAMRCGSQVQARVTPAVTPGNQGATTVQLTCKTPGG
jgi:hypothetical protein